MSPITQPIIGIIASRHARDGGALVAGIGEKYVLAVEAAGGVPMLIPLIHNTDALDALYERCDGLLLAGGGDVDPSLFGAEPHPKLGTVDALRDAVELRLTRRAAADHKPVLGICRGVQVLNVALGGTLFQDLPAELPDTTDHYASRKGPDRAHAAHSMMLEPDSWLAKRLGATELPVNTFHHQALRDVAPGLRITGRSPDGVIEAVEASDEGFLVGVQCHPEELFERADPRWARMFEGFVAAAQA